MVQRELEKIKEGGIEFGFNSLAYAGTMAVKSEEQFEIL